MKLRNRAASKGIWVLPLLSCVALFCVVSPTLPAQDIEPKSRCHFEFFDFGNIERFRQFDDELKTALKSDDAAMLAQLVAFPLRVNAAGTTSIDDPTALESQMDGIFTPRVRAVVAESRPETVFCNWNGISYGGSVWVQPVAERYGVWVVNVGHGDADDSRTAPHVRFVCATPDFRARIEQNDRSDLSLLIWEGVRSIRDRPDVMVRDGEHRREGSGSCGHPVWTFESDSESVEAMTFGCYSDSDPPPDGSTGSLTRTRAGETDHHWCY